MSVWPNSTMIGSMAEAAALSAVVQASFRYSSSAASSAARTSVGAEGHGCAARVRRAAAQGNGGQLLARFIGKAAPSTEKLLAHRCELTGSVLSQYKDP